MAEEVRAPCADRTHAARRLVLVTAHGLDRRRDADGESPTTLIFYASRVLFLSRSVEVFGSFLDDKGAGYSSLFPLPSTFADFSLPWALLTTSIVFEFLV